MIDLNSLKFGIINNLTLITSESCNLNCSYCKIANHYAKDHYKEAEKLKQSFINGSYLNRVSEIFDKYNIDKNQVKSLQYWGQETTTTLIELSNEMEHLFKIFPNVSTSFFSTNSVAYWDRLIYYIKKVDEVTPNPFRIEMQFSYDGDYGNLNARKLNQDALEKNLLQFFQELNKLSLTNVTFEGMFHNVVTMEVIEELFKASDIKIAIKNFWTSIRDFIQECNNLIKDNKKCKLWIRPAPGLINPYNATPEEGKKLASFVKMSRDLGFEEVNSILQLITGDVYLENDYDINFINQQVKEIIGSKQNDISYNFSSSCSGIDGNINIRYTGEIVHCQNAAFVLDKKELLSLNETSFDAMVRLKQLEYPFSYPNLSTASKENVQKYLWKWSGSNVVESLPYQLNYTINMMYLLSKINQIPVEYSNNPEKLIRHAYYICRMHGCWENNLTDTGSLYGREIGQIRFLANGICDLVDDFIKEMRGQ